MAFEWFRRSSHLTRIILVLIILYAVSTIVVFCLALAVMSSMRILFFNPYVTITYAIISFTLTTIISAFHLSTMLRRRKRKTDWIENAGQKT